MTVIDALTQLYCEHSTAAIEQGDGALLLACFGVPDRDALMKLDGYVDAYGLVSLCAATVDGLVQRHAAPQDQAREGVRLLRDMLDNGEPETAQQVSRRLLQCRLYKKGWPEEVKAWYDAKLDILEWRDFLVSYTDRDAPALNLQFRTLITSCLGIFPKGDALKENQVARVITRHLRRYQGLSGFYADSDLQPGERIQAGVEGYCRRAFALVQLIEPLSFDREPPRNWCFYEYQTFTDNPQLRSVLGDKDRHFFVLSEAQLAEIAPANLAPAQKPWHQRIQALKQVSIALPSERNNTLRVKTKDIARQILALRREIIDAWLAH